MEKEGILGGQKAEEVAKRVSFQKELKNAVKDAFYVQVCRCIFGTLHCVVRVQMDTATYHHAQWNVRIKKFLTPFLVS